MTENFYRTGHVDIDHSSFGGLIYPSDFETEYYSENGRHIASRIANDLKFDEQCKKSAFARDKKKGKE